MNKIRKIVLSLFMAMILVLNIANISINADTIYDEAANVKLTFGDGYISLTNMSTTPRMVSVSTAIYNKSTGQYVTNISDEQLLGYYQTISLVLSGYPLNSYSYTFRVNIYRGNTIHSPICWTMTKEIH